MQILLKKLEKLKHEKISETINQRMKEFESFRNASNEQLFQELAFCLLTANFNAAKTIQMQNKIGNGFLTYPYEKLAQNLTELGHRFPNTRANYILDARKHASNLKNTLNSFNNERELRNWVVQNVKGLGMKESSHFLRNIGYKNLAIIDFHIVDLLIKEKLIERCKTITHKKYIEIECVLEQLARKAKLSLAELDLYLWYLETGKVLK